MEVVEDMEEDVLSLLFVWEELNIIHDQHIDQLIEVNEIIDGVVFDRVKELIGKFFRWNIENCLVREVRFCFITDALCKVCFAEANTTVKYKRIECSASRLLRYCETRRTSETIAVSLHIRIKIEIRV